MSTDVCRHICLKICDLAKVDSILSILMARTILQTKYKYVKGSPRMELWLTVLVVTLKM
jgi:hypothetical protein